ncbi:MAG: cobalamin-binding protein, partial [Chloroflexota bacterium]
WCGKRVRRSTITARPGWGEVAAVRDGHIFEIPSSLILQPGPASLTDGVARIHERLAALHNNPSSGLR